MGTKLKLTDLKFTSSASGADVVRAAGVAVELRGVVHEGREVAAIEDHVAADVAQAAGAQVVRHFPEALVGELGIAAAAHDEIAAQLAVDDLAAGHEMGLERERGAEQVQARVGGHELDDRGGVQWALRVVDHNRGAINGLDDDSDRVERHTCPGELRANRRGQLRRGGDSRDREREDKQQCGQPSHQAASPSSSAIAAPASTRSANCASSIT